MPASSLHRPLERAVTVHVVILILAASWVFGGNIWWMRTALALWASLGAALTLAALLQPGEEGRRARRRAWGLLPWLLFVLLVVTSAANPSFRSLIAEGEPVLVHFGEKYPHLPGTVDPERSLRELWFQATVYLSAFNLLLVSVSRHRLRRLFVIGAANALALAVFGTLQNLLQAGYYFGASTSPNARFFATFIYNNHWGAFMILWLGVAAGLLFRYAARHHGRDLWHSPFSLLAVGFLLIAISAPLSASRAATGMAALLVAAVLGHGMLRIAASRRAQGQSIAPPVLTLLLLTAVTLGGVGWLAQRSIQARYDDTRELLASDQSLLDGRLELYRDTWELAMRKPVFGWGFESYAAAFQLMRPRSVELHRQYESSYAEAHSDWLQSVAETGFVGTGLVLLMGVVPLALSLRRRRPFSALPLYTLIGAGLVLLYAWVEFPFANGAVLISFWSLLFATLGYIRPTSHPHAERG